MKPPNITKGNWTLSKRAVNGVEDGNHNVIITCNVRQSNSGDYEQENSANAKLTAAAPELAQTLNFVLERIDQYLAGPFNDPGYFSEQDKNHFAEAKHVLLKAGYTV